MNRKAFVTGLLILFTIPVLYGQKYGADSLKCVENLSLYKINFRMWKDYNFSQEVIDQVPVYEPWKWVFENCPRSSQNIYLDGVVILKYFYDKETDSIRKNQLIDSIMLVYDKRIEYFGKQPSSREGLVLGRKGLDLLTLKPERFADAYAMLERSITLEGNESPGPVLVYYFHTTISNVRAGRMDTSLIIENYDKIMGIVDFNEKRYREDAESLAEWQNIRQIVETTLEPFATCTDLLSIYTKKFEQHPDDPELLKEIIKMLDRQNCTTDPLYFDVTVKLYELEPDPESAFLIGRMLYRKNEYSKALQYLLQATDMADTNSRADCFLLLADAYRNMRDFPKSRSYAYKCAELRPNDGNPYIMIGDLYASSASDCGNDEISSKAAYWAAVDKYYKAKNVDPSTEQVANERIYSYSRGFPAMERLFFHDLKEGDSYTVGCWINETTTIRAAR
ncbi:MAG: hypothetical protein PHD61_05570 [Bacteroidales bacterium]|nr:hypothetical protein [Lentimicrobiaceae bacterium]MDD5694755.1 hypothetical protein [Bacteroidales bacterium]